MKYGLSCHRPPGLAREYVELRNGLFLMCGKNKVFIVTSN